MVTDRVHASHILRLYVWELVDANTHMDLITATVNGKAAQLIPVVPLSDEPLLSSASPRQTYIIYGFVENDTAFGVQRLGTLSLRIIAPDSVKLSEVVNVLSDTFEYEDLATVSINRWSSVEPQFIGVRFTGIRTSYVEVGDPEIKEGGPVEGVVNLNYRYVRDYASITLPA